MRLAILAITPALALASCGKEQATGNTSALDQAVTAQDFETNDVTAIDAATGADANMAADVDIENIGDDNANATRPRASSSAQPPRTAVQANVSRPAAEPAPAATQPAESNSED